jgi:hypothetical protein
MSDLSLKEPVNNITVPGATGKSRVRLWLAFGKDRVTRPTLDRLEDKKSENARAQKFTNEQRFEIACKAARAR